MKGTRIMLALQKKLTCKQNEAKVKRLEKGIEIALCNAEEKEACAEDKLNNLTQNFDVDTDVSTFIKEVSSALFSKDEADTAIKQLKRIQAYLFEVLDVPEDSEK